MDSNILMLTADEVVAGHSFNIYVFIQNIMKPESTIYGEPVLTIDGLILEGDYRAILPWAARDSWMTYEMTEFGLMYVPNWKFTFTMPNKLIAIKADAWIEQPYYNIPWHLDSSTQKIVAVKELVCEFSGFGISEYDKV